MIVFCCCCKQSSDHLVFVFFRPVQDSPAVWKGIYLFIFYIINKSATYHLSTSHRWRIPVKWLSQEHNQQTCRLCQHTIFYAERQTGNCENHFIVKILKVNVYCLCTVWNSWKLQNIFKNTKIFGSHNRRLLKQYYNIIGLLYSFLPSIAFLFVYFRFFMCVYQKIVNVLMDQFTNAKIKELVEDFRGRRARWCRLSTGCGLLVCQTHNLGLRRLL